MVALESIGMMVAVLVVDVGQGCTIRGDDNGLRPSVAAGAVHGAVDYIGATGKGKSNQTRNCILNPSGSPLHLEMAKVFMFEEVAEHKERNDCWLIIFGKVYDVTSFLEDHPGGDEVLLAATEKDATEDFEDVGHSDSAKEMMEKYYIGDIDSSTVPARKKYKPPQQVAHKPNDTGFAVKILQFLVPLLVLGIAFALRFFAKKEE